MSYGVVNVCQSVPGGAVTPGHMVVDGAVTWCPMVLSDCVRRCQATPCMLQAKGRWGQSQGSPRRNPHHSAKPVGGHLRTRAHWRHIRRHAVRGDFHTLPIATCPYPHLCIHDLQGHMLPVPPSRAFYECAGTGWPSPSAPQRPPCPSQRSVRQC